VAMADNNVNNPNTIASLSFCTFGVAAAAYNIDN